MSRPVRAAFTALFVLALMTSTAMAAGVVFPTADAVEPLAPGDRVPSVRVRTVGGEAVDLSKRVQKRGALIVFYRGGW